MLRRAQITLELVCTLPHVHIHIRIDRYDCYKAAHENTFTRLRLLVLTWCVGQISWHTHPAEQAIDDHPMLEH